MSFLKLFKIILLLSPFILVGCASLQDALCTRNIFSDQATYFRTVLEKEASLLNKSCDLDHKESRIRKFSFIPKYKFPFHLILIPENGASRTDLINNGVPFTIANGILRQLQYLDRIDEEYISGDLILIWNKKKKAPSWTGSNVKTLKTLHIYKKNKPIQVTLKKIAENTIIIVSLE